MANDGKEAEGHIQDALKTLERTKKATWVRLYDSKSAGFGSGGNIIPPQPADFIYVTDRGSSLLEVKSSENHLSMKTLPIREYFKECQILGARLWKRANKAALCAYYSLESKQFEIWDMSQVVQAYLAPPRKRQLQGEPIARCKPSGLVDILYDAMK